jgi:serine protease Do
MKLKNFIYSLSSGILGGALVLVVYILVLQQEESGAEPSEHFLVNQYKSGYAGVPVANYSGLVGAENPIDFKGVSRSSIQGVVHVKTQFNVPNYTLYDFIFGTTPRYSSPVTTSGSGVIISSDGYIITNNHVIDNAEKIEIILNDKRSYNAKLIGRDASVDMALLKIEAEDLSYIPYGDSDKLEIGDWVLAIGNPFNLTSTVTAGIVSAKARNINIMSQNMGIESFIQTDAAVNPGNSGGALVNLNGELVGINTAIASKTGSFVGYSFAVPVSIVRKVVADLIEFGEVQRAYIGVNIMDIDAEMAKSLNMEKPRGVYVAGIWENGPAEECGMKTGDIIIEINGTEINSNAGLLEQVSKYRPGDKVNFKVLRNGKDKNLRLELKNKYGNTEIVSTKSIDVLGASFEPITEIEKQNLRIRFGIKVSDLSPGKLMSKGVQKGYIITHINNMQIKTVEDIEQALANADGSVFIEGLYPNGAVAYYAFAL